MTQQEPAAPQPPLGEAIACLRRSLGYTQDQTARAAGMSKSYLTKIENGARAATPQAVHALARALHTTAERLQGKPYLPPVGPDLEPLRTRLRRYDLPPTHTPNPQHVQGNLARAAALRENAQYQRLAELLPDLLGDATAVAYQQQTPAAWHDLADLYGAAWTLAHRLGTPDLCATVSALQRWAAEHSESPVALACAQWTRAGTFQTAGEYSAGMEVMQRAITDLHPHANTAPALAVLGSLHLRASTLAARSRDQEATSDHLDRAARIAEDLPSGPDTRVHMLTFGRDNTQLHRIGAAVDLGEHQHATTTLEAMHATPMLPPTRLTHMWIDGARAYADLDQREKATECLLRASAVGGELARVHPMAREVGWVLLSRHRRSNADLVALAQTYRLAL